MIDNKAAAAVAAETACLGHITLHFIAHRCPLADARQPPNIGSSCGIVNYDAETFTREYRNQRVKFPANSLPTPNNSLPAGSAKSCPSR